MKQSFMILCFAAVAAAGCRGCRLTDASWASTTPASCPSAQPSYEADVAPILQSYCVSCHEGGGGEFDRPLDTYRSAQALSSHIENEVTEGTMPPWSEAQLTAVERETRLTWIRCGATND